MNAALTFGGWLKRRRGGLGLTQKALAQLAGYAEVTLRKVEADELRPSRQMAEALAAALQLAPEDRAAFIRFARDEPSAEDARLPTQATSTVPTGVPTVPPVPPSNLPAPLTACFGRDRQVQQLAHLLRRRDVRLVTLTGPGGIGKTRLGLEVAAELGQDFADGIFFVALAPIRHKDLVIPAIAQTLGVRDPSGRPLLESVSAHLRGQHLLLLLDNFEQVLEAAPLLTALLQNCPRLTILVTSRARLHLYGEHEVPVPPLARPDLNQLGPNVADLPQFLAQYAAVELFVERAQAANPSFALTPANAPAVAEICVRLDGLPLALELAAARSKLFHPQALLALLGSSLGGRLELLTGGGRDLPPRQQTLRATLAWSYDLLTKPQQALFRRLSLFVGGFTLEAAAAVCGEEAAEPLQTHWAAGSAALPPLALLDDIDALVDKSLVWQMEPPASSAGGAAGSDPLPRWGLLETLRAYGLEQLAAAGEGETLGRRYVRFYLALAEAADVKLVGPEQPVWLARLDAEHDNLRAAMEWCYQGDRDLDSGLRLANALWLYWRLRVYLSEGREVLERFLRRAGKAVAPAMQARALARAGWLAVIHGDLPRAVALCEQALPLARAVEEPWSAALACNVLGTVARSHDQLAAAGAHYAEALAISRAIGDAWLIALSLGNQGILAFLQARDAEAGTLLEDAFVRFQAAGDRFYRAAILNLLGRVARKQGDAARAALFPERA